MVYWGCEALLVILMQTRNVLWLWGRRSVRRRKLRHCYLRRREQLFASDRLPWALRRLANEEQNNPIRSSCALWLYRRDSHRKTQLHLCSSLSIKCHIQWSLGNWESGPRIRRHGIIGNFWEFCVLAGDFSFLNGNARWLWLQPRPLYIIQQISGDPSGLKQTTI